MKTKSCKVYGIILVMLSITIGNSAQNIFRDLSTFAKIVVNPHISLTLIYGESENIELAAINVDTNKINIKVEHGTLFLSLDNWYKAEKIKEGRKKYTTDPFKNAKVNATVTYNQLKTIVIRGDEQVICYGNIKNDVFRLRAYGESKLIFQHIEARNLTTKLYGENKLEIQSGEITSHKSRLYGENEIDMANIHTQKTRCTSFGESKLVCSSEAKFRVNSFGESEFTQHGEAKIHRMIALGENKYLYAFCQQ